MAAGLQPPNGSSQNVSLELKKLPSRLPLRVTDSKVALAEHKRQSWNTLVLRPDPFRFGDPNPLTCHPWFSPKHPDYIHRPSSIHGTPSLPAVADNSGAQGVTLRTHESNLVLERSGDSFISKPVRVDSLIVQNYLIYEEELLRVSSSYEEKELPPTPLSEKFMHMTPSFDQAQEMLQQQSQRKFADGVEGSIEDFNKPHEVNVIQDIKGEKAAGLPQNIDSISVPPATGGFNSLLQNSQPPISRVRYNVEETPRLKTSLSSGLPKGWSNIHDRFIAYLDTHAPLSKDGSIPVRNWEYRSYNTDEVIYMLHKKFPNFRNTTITAWAIEKRLAILDLKENNYFSMPYGCYKFEEWGQGI